MEGKHADQTNEETEMRVLLTNNFHGTSTHVCPKPLGNGEYRVSRRAAMRASNVLCGIAGCTCGDTFGARGGPYLEVLNETYERDYIVSIQE